MGEAETMTRTRRLRVPVGFREAIAAIDTRDLADLLAAANPWMTGAVEHWFHLAVGVKDFLEQHPDEPAGGAP